MQDTAQNILSLYYQNCEIICTHNFEIKDSDDKKYNLKRLCFNDFLKDKEILLKDVSFILNSIPPTEHGDIVINNLKENILENKKTKMVWLFFFHQCLW